MPFADRKRSVRLWIVACFATVAALIGAVLVPMAALASGVALSGTVTGPTGKALAGDSVSVVEITLGVPTILATTTTSSTGAYAFAALGAGTGETLQFAATSTTYRQYLGDTSDLSAAQTFDLSSSGSAHTTVNANLAAGGSIGGSVKSITHAALKGYTVRAFANGSDQTVVRSAVTSATGAYTITGLEPGLYQLEAIDTAANPPYGPAYSGGAATLDAADTVQVAAAKTTAYSFTLGKAGGISGVVTGDTGSGTQNLGGVTVTPYLLEGPSPSFTGSTTLGMTPVTTKADGTYSIAGLTPGYYTLEFAPGGTTPVSPFAYGRSFLGGASDAPQADAVHVLGGTTVDGTDEELFQGGGVTGTIENSADNAPVDNIQVTLDYLDAPADQPGNGAQTVVTGLDGTFTFSGLGEGQYEIIVGSNTNTATDTSWQREIVNLPVQVPGSGGTASEPVTFVTAKDPQGLHATTIEPLTCCGMPFKVGGDVAVDYQDFQWNDGFIDYNKDTIQWLRNGQPIPGATGNQYLLAADDAGQLISARVTAYDLAYGSGSADTPAIGPIGNGTIYSEAGGGFAPSSSTVGQPLTYLSSGWSVPGVTETDVWQLSPDGSTGWTNMVPQPTSNVHVETSDDQLNGPYIRVEATATHPGYDPVVIDSSADYVNNGNFTLTKAPKLTTTASAWSVTGGTWSPNVGTTQYLWTVHHSNNTSTTYNTSNVPSVTTTLLRSHAVASDWVEVEVFRQPAGYNAYFAPRVTAQTATAPVPNTAPTLTGTPQFGTLLSATIPTFSPSVTTVHCAWQYKSGSTWKAVAFAPLCTYTPVSGDIGRTLRVTLTTADPGYVPYSITLTEPTTIAALSLGNTVLPGISGSATTGNTVTAGSGSWSPSPSGFSYHWKYSANGLAPFKVAPGTSDQSSYAIPQLLLNQVLLVDVQATLNGHTSMIATASAGSIGPGYLTVLASPKVKQSGTILTASGFSFTPVPAAADITYNWYVYNSDDSTYSQFSNHMLSNNTLDFSTFPHKRIELQVGGVLPGYNTTFTALVLAKKGDEEPTGTLTIAGGTVGQSMTSGGVSWSIDGSTISDQWQYKSGSTWKSIPGATSSTYTASGTYVGKSVRLVETASQTGYNSGSVTSNTLTVTQAPAITPGSGGEAPFLGGDNQVGLTLTITPGTWNALGATFGYQWQLSHDGLTWTNISGATSSHLVVPLTAFTANDYVGVLITASAPGYAPGNTRIVTEAQTVEGALTSMKSPTIKVTGTTLTVSPGTWSPSATSYSYQWQTITPVAFVFTPVGTDSPSYTPVGADAGDAITVTVTAHLANYTDATATALARSGGPITPTTPITVTGTASTGDTLTASWTGFSVDSPAEAYQWYRNGVAMTGETNQTYSPVTADVGKVDSVAVTVSQNGWTTEKYTAASGVIQLSDSLDFSAPPKITGSAVVDGSLTVSNAVWTVPGVTVTYQWYRSGGIIAGATGTKYTPTLTDLGNDIYVLVAGDKPFQTERVASTGLLTIGIGADLSPLTPVTISGVYGAGKVLTGSSNTWNFPVTLTYQWQEAPPLTSSWGDIPGATASTFTPTALEFPINSHLQLVVTASRPGHPSVQIASAPITVT